MKMFSQLMFFLLMIIGIILLCLCVWVMYNVFKAREPILFSWVHVKETMKEKEKERH
jgi:hypothetical protein